MNEGTPVSGINNLGEVDGNVYSCNLSGPPLNSGCSTQTGFTLDTRSPSAQYNYFIGAGDTGASTAPPYSGGTAPQGINDFGDVVGHSNEQYFVGWEYANGKMITISDPKASSSLGWCGCYAGTAPGGINDEGTVTGIYFNPTAPGNSVGFIGSGFIARPTN